MGYKHIVFDIDGTMIDTKQEVLLSLRDTLKELTGEARDQDSLEFVLGIPGEDALRQLPVEDPAEALKLWNRNMDRYRHTVQVFPGIRKLLHNLVEAGYELGIITSETGAEMEAEFIPFGIHGYFGTVVNADDTEGHKPSPEPLLKYMELTGVSARELLYLGDSVYDAQCAKGAGVDFALAGWGRAGDRIEADYTLQLPEELLGILKIV